MDVRVILLGDPDVGKSSFIQTYVSGQFGEAPKLCDPVQLPFSPQDSSASGRPLEGHNVTLYDTDGAALSSSVAVANKLREVRALLLCSVTRTAFLSIDHFLCVAVQIAPDVAILCFAADAPQTLVRLVTHWLPALRAAAVLKPHWPYLPVCVCGTKDDLVASVSAAAWVLALKDIARCAHDSGLREGDDLCDLSEEALSAASCTDLRSRCLELVLLAFQECLGTANVSAVAASSPGVVPGLWDVIHQAVWLVLFPVHPIWDPLTDELQPGFDVACQRIFRILDADRDGLLSVDEFAQYQTTVFEMRLTEDEIVTFFEVCSFALRQSAWSCWATSRSPLFIAGERQRDTRGDAGGSRQPLHDRPGLRSDVQGMPRPVPR
jgi:hypothetical protein